MVKRRADGFPANGGRIVSPEQTLTARTVRSRSPKTKSGQSRRYRGVPTRPFLKWAGGKGQLLDRISPHIPEQFGRYYEPFVGSGALFFHLSPHRASLSDSNERLVRTYIGLRDHYDQVIELLQSYPHDKDFFLKLRKWNIDERSDAEVAAWLIYLNKTAFNGLYRVNRRNEFNVPFGAFVNPGICRVKTLRACAQRLRGVRLTVLDFEQATRRARRGDLVYFDPPYVPLSATSDFTGYTAGGFGPDEQRRLRDVALKLKSRGVHVVLSNSGAPFVRELYAEGFTIEELLARRAINCQAKGRGKIVELLIH